MKMRLGFVSNSSSSSFVIITTQTILDKVLAKLTIIEKLAAQDVFEFSNEKVMGEDRLVCTTHYSTEDIGSGWDFLPEDCGWDSKEYQAAYNGLDKFYSLISKEKDTFAKNWDC